MNQESYERVKMDWEKTFNDRIRAIAEYQTAMAQIAEKIEDIEHKKQKRAAIDDALQMLANLVRETNASHRQAQDRLARTRRFADIAKPVFSGGFWPRQNIMLPLESFRMLLQSVNGDDYRQLAAMTLTPEELAPENFGSPRPIDPSVFEDRTKTDFFAVYRWMKANILYPVQMTPLHNRFVVDVFPKIQSSIDREEKRLLDETEVHFKRIFDTVKAKLASVGVNA